MRAQVNLRQLLTGLLLLAPTVASAQELTPRAYWPAPEGTQILLLGYTHSTGDVVTDPTLPVVGVESSIHLGLAAYARTLSLWGRTANLLIEVPYSQGVTKGDLEGNVTRRDFSGLADIALTLSVNFLGAPSMTPEEFQQLRLHPRPILGGSVRIVAPTGEYDPDSLINVGTNRWAVKGELGAILPLAPRWLLELDLGAWAIGDNDDFLGVTRQQDPILAFQGHLIRRFKPGFWGALNLNYYVGGRSTIGGALIADLQRNSRAGFTIVVPLRNRYSAKLGYSTGVVTASGDDYDRFLLSFGALL